MVNILILRHARQRALFLVRLCGNKESKTGRCPRYAQAGLPTGSAVRPRCRPPYALRPGRPAIRSCSPSGPPNARQRVSPLSNIYFAPNRALKSINAFY
jgi:hypothetical protein